MGIGVQPVSGNRGRAWGPVSGNRGRACQWE